MSEKQDTVLRGIQERLQKGAKQLDTDISGLLCCYLSGISDLKVLANNSGLQKMTSYLLSKNSFAHVVAVSYASEAIINTIQNTEKHTLHYRLTVNIYILQATEKEVTEA